MSTTTTNALDELRPILMHPAVSRTLRKRGKNRSLLILRRLRIRIRDWRRAVRNYHEDYPHAEKAERAGGAGAAYEAGYSTARPAMPRVEDIANDLLRMDAAELPDDLAHLCGMWLVNWGGK